MFSFSVNQKISFTTNSSLYKDVYEAEIIHIFPDRLDFRLSLYHGYLLLLPVGTMVHWILPQSPHLKPTSQVITRDIAHKFWSTTKPIFDTRTTKVLAIGSGKGGVGKTTFAINLGLAFSQLKQKVILLDADIGMANIEILMGMSSPLNLTDVIRGDCTLSQILVQGPGGLQVLPGSSGISSLTKLDSIQFNRIISGFLELEQNCDILIIDTGAGLSELVLNFLQAADDFILLTTPEPHALMDGYALTKALVQNNKSILPKLIVNKCESETEARQSSATFIHAAKVFLGIDPLWLGWLPDDNRISYSLKKQTPLFLSHPQIDFSRRISRIAQTILGENEDNRQIEVSGLKNFWDKVKKSFAI